MSKKLDIKVLEEEKKALLLNARNPSGVYEEVFATNGDKATPPFTYTDGWNPTYESTSFPERTTFNFLLNRHDAAIVDMNQMGANLQWDTVLTYQQYAQVVGSNGNSYRALVSNQGIDPVSDGGVNWELLPTASDISSLQSAVSTLQSEVAILQTYAPKAFVKFDQNGNILGSTLNISGINVQTLGSGILQRTFVEVTMSTPMSNTNYRVVTSGSDYDAFTTTGGIPEFILIPNTFSTTVFTLTGMAVLSTSSNISSMIPRQGGIAAVYEF